MEESNYIPGTFPKDVKEKWLEALKSGKYKQGFNTLEDCSTNSFCCIGVLGDIMDELDNNAPYTDDDHVNRNPANPYEYLKSFKIDIDEIYETNDDIEYKNTGQTDYSNVIPLIEQL